MHDDGEPVDWPRREEVSYALCVSVAIRSLCASLALLKVCSVSREDVAYDLTTPQDCSLCANHPTPILVQIDV